MLQFPVFIARDVLNMHSDIAILQKQRLLSLLQQCDVLQVGNVQLTPSILYGFPASTRTRSVICCVKSPTRATRQPFGNVAGIRPARDFGGHRIRNPRTHTMRTIA